MTGGSSTIPDTYEKLRVAGAVARETLKAAAAKRSGVPVADIRTKSGQVILPDGTRIPYVELAAEAAKIPVEACYLGWQESLSQLAHVVEPEIPSAP